VGEITAETGGPGSYAPRPTDRSGDESTRPIGRPLALGDAGFYDEFEGYLFSPPVPADQFRRFLEGEQKNPEGKRA
jgi:hypothetical protein